VTQADIEAFVATLENVPESVKQRLRELRVERYTGLAESLVDWYFSKINIERP